MENSQTFETADDSIMDTADDSAYDATATESDDADDGGYIESKAPDFDESDESDLSDEADKPAFSDSILKYLDGITEKDASDAKPARAPAQPRPAQSRPAPQTAAQEEQAIIASIPSERGRERIKSIISARHEAENRYKENQGVINNIRNFVEQVGVEPAELAQNIEYSRLVAQGDENSLKIALSMLEDQRDIICKRLNIDRPGVDLLSDCPELKAAVQRKEITPEHAVKLAKYERQERQAVQQKEERKTHDENSARFLHDLEDTKHAIVSYLNTRAGEADHNFKITRLYEHLSKPGVLKELTQNLDSKRWFSQIRFMYDNIVVPPSRPQTRMQPIRSRPTMQGSVSNRPDASLMDKMNGILDGMGI